MYVEDKYAIYHYTALYKDIDKDGEFFYFYRDSIQRTDKDQFKWHHKTLHYIDLDLLDNKEPILHMMYSDNKIDRELAYEILKTNGCIKQC